MNYAEWIAAGFIAAIIIFVFKYARHCSALNSRMTNFVMDLLLDELSYRRRRDEFLKLIETPKVEDSTTLFGVVMLELEQNLERTSPKWTAISRRMWLMNQKAIQTGRSVTDFSNDAVEEISATATPNLDQHIPVARLGIRMVRIIWKIKRHFRRIFGAGQP